MFNILSETKCFEMISLFFFFNRKSHSIPWNCCIFPKCLHLFWVSLFFIFHAIFLLNSFFIIVSFISLIYLVALFTPIQCPSPCYCHKIRSMRKIFLMYGLVCCQPWKHTLFFKIATTTLAGQLGWLEHRPDTPRLQVLSWVWARARIQVEVSFFFSLPLSPLSFALSPSLPPSPFFSLKSWLKNK